MHFSFEEWLLLTENMTAAQFLKLPAYREFYNRVKNEVTNYIAYDLLPGQNVNQNTISRLANWTIKEFIRGWFKITDPPIGHAMLSVFWNQRLKGWINATINNNQVQSQFASVEFSWIDAARAARAWENTEKIRTAAAREGRTLVSLEDVPDFQGWKWVTLDRSYCDREAETMGHCGNQYGGSLDNILSLRDPNNAPHLTFINKQGVLGEMKGKKNSKPSRKYHPAIIKLLLSNEIRTIGDGGEEPETNFSLADLTPEQQKYIRIRKPNFDNPAIFAKGPK